MKPRRFESDTIVSSSATAGATSFGSVGSVTRVSADTRPWNGRAGRNEAQMLAPGGLTRTDPEVDSANRPISVVRPTKAEDGGPDRELRHRRQAPRGLHVQRPLPVLGRRGSR